eukprot:7396559-Pyramimonas_sp.AAC.1
MDSTGSSKDTPALGTLWLETNPAVCASLGGHAVRPRRKVGSTYQLLGTDFRTTSFFPCAC